MNINNAGDSSLFQFTSPHRDVQDSSFNKENTATQSEYAGANDKHNTDSNQGNATQNRDSQPRLSENEKQQADELAARDREVRAHEAAHKAAGGSLAGAASFSYTTGPDGKRYATGGEVGIDTSKVSGDPQATINKANRIRAAALAPTSPSSQDQRVAAQAAQMAAEARAELALQKSREANGSEPTSTSQKYLQTSGFDSRPLQEYRLAGQNQDHSQQLDLFI